MKFRTRLVVTLSAASAATTIAAFGAASYAVERSEERQLDDALRAEARQEALEVASSKERRLRISDRGGPEADDIGRLTKFAVLYGEDRRVLDHTLTFAHDVPALDTLHQPKGVPFDFVYDRERLRGILVALSGKRQEVLLLAAPRADLEKDTTFLRKVMLVAALLSVCCTILVTWRVVRRLTRGHEEIALVARKVAAGNFAARIAMKEGDDEVVQLARDVDEMVARLAVLVESQQRFVAHAAHELRSPLTSLYGELQLALRRSRSAEEYRTTIEAALDSARRLKALAEDLLALARLGADREAQQGPVALGEVARHAAQWVSNEASRRHIELAVDTDASSVFGHAIDLERLLRNLLDNAIRHSPDGGTVRVEARSEGDVVHLSVLDDGPGVSAEERQRIFEPFYRSAVDHARDDGSGLGLAIVREIARVHGGDVDVEDGPHGKGARFRAQLRSAPRAVR